MANDPAGTRDTEPVSAQILAALDAGGATCRAWPEQEEGPYHRDHPPIRRDVVEDAPGSPLVLGVRLVDARGAPVKGGTLEIWHCDALGRYSGFPPPDAAADYVPDRMFLRGAQPVDASGSAEFHTVYPGWYPGRTIHIHVRVQIADESFTSQLYFPENINADVLARSPYVERPGRDTTNADDAIAATANGPAVLQIVVTDDGHLATTCLQIPIADGRRRSA